MTHRLSKAAKGEWFVLVGPYDSALVDALKHAVPASGREWRQVAKVWRIAPEYAGIVQALIDGGSKR
jgi:hypothetical protein